MAKQNGKRQRARRERLTCSVEEASEILELGRNQTYDAIKRGEIPAIRFGRTYRVSLQRLYRMINDEAA